MTNAIFPFPPAKLLQNSQTCKFRFYFPSFFLFCFSFLHKNFLNFSLLSTLDCRKIDERFTLDLRYIDVRLTLHYRFITSPEHTFATILFHSSFSFTAFPPFHGRLIPISYKKTKKTSKNDKKFARMKKKL